MWRRPSGHTWQLLCFRSDVTCTWQLLTLLWCVIAYITQDDRPNVISVSPPHMPDFDQLLEEADDQLLERILNDLHHTLYQLLPPQSATPHNYILRRRTHDRQLHEHQGHLSDCNFITKLQYKNSYWLNSIYVNEIFTVQTISFIYKLTHHNFICGLSNVIIKTFSQSVRHGAKRCGGTCDLTVNPLRC